MAEPTTAQMLASVASNKELLEIHNALEKTLEYNIKLEAKEIRELVGSSKRILDTKRKAQREVSRLISHLKHTELSQLMLPDSTLKFEAEWGEIDEASRKLQILGRKYSLCVKIFINIFIHEAKALESIDVTEIVRKLEQQKHQIMVLEESIKGTFEQIFKDLKEISALSNNEVAKFAAQGAVTAGTYDRAVFVQRMADFIVAYREICLKERECFEYIDDFFKSNKKHFRSVNKDAAMTRKFLKHRTGVEGGGFVNLMKTDVRDMRVVLEPLSWVGHAVEFLGTVAMFTGLGEEFGILRGVWGKVFAKSVHIFGTDQFELARMGLEELAKFEEEIVEEGVLS